MQQSNQTNQTKQARTWAEIIADADAGHTPSQLLAADCFYFGSKLHGVSPDKDKRRFYLEAAVKNKSKEARYNLGLLEMHSENYERASALFLPGAHAGDNDHREYMDRCLELMEESKAAGKTYDTGHGGDDSVRTARDSGAVNIYGNEKRKGGYAVELSDTAGYMESTKAEIDLLRENALSIIEQKENNRGGVKDYLIDDRQKYQFAFIDKIARKVVAENPKAVFRDVHTEINRIIAALQEKDEYYLEMFVVIKESHGAISRLRQLGYTGDKTLNRKRREIRIEERIILPQKPGGKTYNTGHGADDSVRTACDSGAAVDATITFRKLQESKAPKGVSFRESKETAGLYHAMWRGLFTAYFTIENDGYHVAQGYTMTIIIETTDAFMSYIKNKHLMIFQDDNKPAPRKTDGEYIAVAGENKRQAVSMGAAAVLGNMAGMILGNITILLSKDIDSQSPDPYRVTVGRWEDNRRLILSSTETLKADTQIYAEGLYYGMIHMAEKTAEARAIPAGRIHIDELAAQERKLPMAGVPIFPACQWRKRTRTLPAGKRPLRGVGAAAVGDDGGPPVSKDMAITMARAKVNARKLEAAAKLATAKASAAAAYLTYVLSVRAQQQSGDGEHLKDNWSKVSQANNAVIAAEKHLALEVKKADDEYLKESDGYVAVAGANKKNPGPMGAAAVEDTAPSRAAPVFDQNKGYHFAPTREQMLNLIENWNPLVKVAEKIDAECDSEINGFENYLNGRFSDSGAILDGWGDFEFEIPQWETVSGHIENFELDFECFAEDESDDDAERAADDTPSPTPITKENRSGREYAAKQAAKARDDYAAALIQSCDYSQEDAFAEANTALKDGKFDAYQEARIYAIISVNAFGDDESKFIRERTTDHQRLSGVETLEKARIEAQKAANKNGVRFFVLSCTPDQLGRYWDCDDKHFVPAKDAPGGDASHSDDSVSLDDMDGAGDGPENSDSIFYVQSDWPLGNRVSYYGVEWRGGDNPKVWENDGQFNESPMEELFTDADSAHALADYLNTADKPFFRDGSPKNEREMLGTAVVVETTREDAGYPLEDDDDDDGDENRPLHGVGAAAVSDTPPTDDDVITVDTDERDAAKRKASEDYGKTFATFTSDKPPPGEYADAAEAHARDYAKAFPPATPPADTPADGYARYKIYEDYQNARDGVTAAEESLKTAREVFDEANAARERYVLTNNNTGD